jgi:hypothetical protein
LEQIDPQIYRIFRTTPSTNSGDDLGSKKHKFKASGIKKDVLRMDLVDHQDMTEELSTRLLAAQ